MGEKLLVGLRARLRGLNTNDMKAIAAKTGKGRDRVSWQTIYKISKGLVKDPGILTVERILKAIQ